MEGKKTGLIFLGVELAIGLVGTVFSAIDTFKGKKMRLAKDDKEEIAKMVLEGMGCTTCKCAEAEVVE